MAKRAKITAKAFTVRLDPDVVIAVEGWSGKTDKSASWVINAMVRGACWSMSGSNSEALLLLERLKALHALKVRKIVDEDEQKKLRIVERKLASRQPPMLAQEVVKSLKAGADLTTGIRVR